MACVMQGQPQIATWTETHPGLRVARWTCRGTAGREMKARSGTYRANGAARRR